jgi:CopG family transcriptional regulator, nickel-responsive regulator
MVIISISLDAALLEKFDAVTAEKGFSNRSEAFREMVRMSVDEWQMSKKTTSNIAAIMVVSDKNKTKGGIERVQHKYVETQTMLHTHLDDKNCLEIFIIKGDSSRLDMMIKELRKVQGVKKVDFFTTTADL